MFRQIVFGLTGVETLLQLKQLVGLEQLLEELKERNIPVELVDTVFRQNWTDSLLITDCEEMAETARASGNVCIGYAPPESGSYQPWAELVLEGFEEVDLWLLEQTWCHGKGEPFRVAEGKRIYLQELTEVALPKLYRIYHQPEIMEYVQEMSGEYGEEARKLAAYQSAYHFYGCGIWGIYRKTDDRLLGSCGLEMKEWEEEARLELGYVLDKAVWGCGYATEAAELALECARRLGYDTVWAKIDRRNYHSQTVAERIGMKREACHAEKYKAKTDVVENSAGIQQTYVYRRTL